MSRLQCGSQITWDGRLWNVVNLGETSVSLLSEHQKLTELPVAAFEALIRENRMQVAGDESNLGSDAPNDDRLSRASEGDLKVATYRSGLIRQYLDRPAAATIAGAIYFLSVLAGSVWVKDTIIRSGLAQPYKWSLYIPALVSVAVIPVWLLARPFAALVLACALSCAAGNSLGTAIYQARVGYSTTYDYGQNGFEDAVSFIRMNTRPDEAIASMKDIGFKTGRRYVENYGPIYGGPDQTGQLIEAISSGKVRYAVFTAQRGQDNLDMNPRLKTWVEQNCALVRSPGDYRIYSYIDRKQQ